VFFDLFYNALLLLRRLFLFRELRYPVFVHGAQPCVQFQTICGNKKAHMCANSVNKLFIFGLLNFNSNSNETNWEKNVVFDNSAHWIFSIGI
jgi:hypothetical protein